MNFPKLRYQVTTVGKSTELQKVEVPGTKGRGWEELLTHAECQRLYKGKDFAVTVRLELPGQEIKILGKKTTGDEARNPRYGRVFFCFANLFSICLGKVWKSVGEPVHQDAEERLHPRLQRPQR